MKRKYHLVRYVPGQNGSPAWMTEANAEREAAKENNTADALARCGVRVPRPHIERPLSK
jgi:hypothetical protein